MCMGSALELPSTMLAMSLAGIFECISSPPWELFVFRGVTLVKLGAWLAQDASEDSNCVRMPTPRFLQPLKKNTKAMVRAWRDKCTRGWHVARICDDDDDDDHHHHHHEHCTASLNPGNVSCLFLFRLAWGLVVELWSLMYQGGSAMLTRETDAFCDAIWATSSSSSITMNNSSVYSQTRTTA